MIQSQRADTMITPNTNILKQRGFAMPALLSAAALLLASCGEQPAKIAAPAPQATVATPATPTPASPTIPATTAAAATADAKANTDMPEDPKSLTEEQWKKRLTPEQYYILRQKGTERAFTGKYWDTDTPGVYKCAGCSTVLFKSDAKFDSHCGWPSFDKMIADGVIEEHRDTSHGMVRTEVVCKKCGGHLGHVFEDGPTATGLRYCINSASIELEPEKK